MVWFAVENKCYSYLHIDDPIDCMVDLSNEQLPWEKKLKRQYLVSDLNNFDTWVIREYSYRKLT